MNSPDDVFRGSHEEFLTLLVQNAPSTVEELTTELAPEYREYCQQQAELSTDSSSEIYRFLATCGWITDKLFERAFSMAHASERPRTLVSKELVLALEAWQKGVVVNLGVQIFTDAYQTIMRWWRRVCRALSNMTRISLENETARAIALAADLSIARYA